MVSEWAVKWCKTWREVGPDEDRDVNTPKYNIPYICILRFCDKNTNKPTSFPDAIQLHHLSEPTIFGKITACFSAVEM